MQQTKSKYSPEKIQEHREALLKALRSGEYEQGSNRLHKGNTYCPWGIGCDVSGLGEWEALPADSVAGSDTFIFTSSKGNEGIMWPPPKVMKYYGVGRKIVGNVMQLNDVFQLGFEAIADHLAERWGLN